MGKSNTFEYKTIEFTFCGFYEDKFVFYANGKVFMVESIAELMNMCVSSIKNEYGYAKTS